MIEGSLSFGVRILRIVKYPHPTLRHKSRELKRVDADLRRAIAEMFELMYEYRGIGLAANQVDLPYRVFILNVTGDPDARDQEHVLINPTILKWSGTVEAEEGCLSFPDIYAPVRRSERIVAAAYNLAGEEKRYEVDGLFAGPSSMRTTISTERSSSIVSAPATWRTSGTTCSPWRPSSKAIGSGASCRTTA